MSFLRSGRQTRSLPTGRERADARRFVPCLETLEDRTVLDGVPAPGNSLTLTNLVSPLAAQQLVQQLVGNNVTISNVQFTGTAGSEASAASFAADSTGPIGITKGVMLASSVAAGVVGNESLDSDDGRAGVNLGLPGDTQLNSLVGVSSSDAFDASVLQFNFVPKGQFLTLKYVFGSTEYNGRLGSPTDLDAFGIFVNGQVVSLVPGTKTSVQVSSVNISSNPQFFVDNCDDDFSTPDGIEFTPHAVTLSGYTTVLQLDVPVNSGVVNTMKIGVEDTGAPTGFAAGFFVDGSLTAGGPSAFKPFRYVYNQSDQTYQGNVTVVNNFVVPVPAPIALAFENIPAKATLINATGMTSGANGTPVLPVISLPEITTSLTAGVTVRTQVIFTDPAPPAFLSTFFEGIIVDILSGPAAASVISFAAPASTAL
jgi:hypothetical protein